MSWGNQSNDDQYSSSSGTSDTGDSGGVGKGKYSMYINIHVCRVSQGLHFVREKIIVLKKCVVL